MNDGFFLDIILFAMVAAFLVLRLRHVLGRRTGNQGPRDAAKRRKESENEGNVIELADRTGAADEADEAEDLTADAESDDPLVAGVARIRLADPKFDADEFASGARSAFEMIVHAFATADSGTLRSLLSEEVAENFQNAIKTRLEAGETLETTVISIKTATVIEAEMRGHDAAVTLKFVSEQVNVTRDTEGRVIEGDPNQVTDITDIWTFARNTRTRDPNWKLIETRSSN